MGEARYEVFPKGDTWNWRRRENGRSKETGDGYKTRSDAITAARAVDTDGLAVVLLRKDGSEVGVLPHPAEAEG
jgi:hypothetical protein